MMEIAVLLTVLLGILKVAGVDISLLVVFLPLIVLVGVYAVLIFIIGLFTLLILSKSIDKDENDESDGEEDAVHEESWQEHLMKTLEQKDKE